MNKNWKEKLSFKVEIVDGLEVTGVRVDLADLSLRLTEGLDYLSKGIAIGTDSTSLPESPDERMKLMANVSERKRSFYLAVLRRTVIAPKLTDDEWEIISKAVSNDKLAEYLAEVTGTSDSSGIKSNSEPQGESQIPVGPEPSVSLPS